MAPSESASPIAPELKKLTVPQLKALCKEKGLTQYSRLTKDAIILKLSPYYSAPGHTASSEGISQTSGSSCSVPPTPARSAPVKENGPARLAVTSNSSGSSQVEQHIATPTTTSSKNKNLTQVPGHTPGAGPSSNSGVEPGIQDVSRPNNKRALPKDAANKNARAKLPRVLEGNHQTPSHLQNDGTFKLPALPSRILTKAVQVASSLVPASQIIVDVVESTPTKRFKPLAAANGTKDAVGSKSTSKETAIAMPSAAENQLATRSGLDFPVESDVSLRQITLPPSIAGRKQAQKFAIILSGISHMELKDCRLASKTLRYSG